MQTDGGLFKSLCVYGVAMARVARWRTRVLARDVRQTEVNEVRQGGLLCDTSTLRGS